MSQSRETAFHAITSKTAAGFDEEAGMALGHDLRRPRRPSTAPCARTSACGTSRPSTSGMCGAPRPSRRSSGCTRTTSSACVSARSATAPSWTRTACWSTTAPSYKHADEHLWMCTNGERARGLLRRRHEGARGLDRLHRTGTAQHADPGPAIARADALHHRGADRRAGATSRSSPSRSRSAASRPGCREPDSPGSSATRCSCGPSTPRRSGKRSSPPAPGPTAWRSSKRSGSRPA